MNDIAASPHAMDSLSLRLLGVKTIEQDRHYVRINVDGYRVVSETILAIFEWFAEGPDTAEKVADLVVRYLHLSREAAMSDNPHVENRFYEVDAELAARIGPIQDATLPLMIHPAMARVFAGRVSDAAALVDAFRRDALRPTA